VTRTSCLVEGLRISSTTAEQGEHLLLAPWYLLRALIRKLMGKKNNWLTDDIVTRMVRTAYPGAVDFDIKRLGINAGGLLIGAIETTSRAVAQVIQYLLNDPACLPKARSAAQNTDPTQFDGIVWEALRFVPISAFLIALQENHECTSRARSRLLGSLRAKFPASKKCYGATAKR